MNQTFRVPQLSLVRCLVSWVGISALSMSPALAQVNGSGTSPANLFDVVLDLPGDEAVITGGFSESIGQGLGLGQTGQTTQLNVNDGGTVGVFFGALSGGEVNISGGTVGSSFLANIGSEVNISGGNVDFLFQAGSSSEVNISGGTVGAAFQAFGGSEVNISGGSFGAGFTTFAGSDVELIGGEFRLNGADFPGGTITLAPGGNDVFTGTLADGSSFIFSEAAFDELRSVTLTAAALPAAELNPIVINAPVVSGPVGLRAGQTLTLEPGGSLGDNFAVVDATLNVEGGVVGEAAESFNSEVNISGGTLGDFFDAEFGSQVNISGGTVGIAFRTFLGSEVNISGGDVGEGFFAVSGVVNISGGIVGDSFNARPSSEVNISGGTVGNGFNASSGSTVNIMGNAFFIDGEELDALVLGEAFTVAQRDVTLSGLLADGEPFSFRLNSVDSSDNDFFDPFATLTVTLDSPVVVGDVNLDGVVSFLDISPFIAVLSSGRFQAEADINQDGVVSFLDISPFIGILSGS